MRIPTIGDSCERLFQRRHSADNQTFTVNSTYILEMVSKEELLVSSKLDGLNTFTTWVYGVGHVFNDLCAACWFNYLLYYVANVQGVGSSTAGLVMFSGQLADGICTPLVGLLSDKFNTSIGKRKPWYILGTIIVPICFYFVFERCFPCEYISWASEPVFKVLWYCLYAALFNVGWASVQISHMSLIPALTPLKERKERLIAIRTSFTYLANIAVLLTALILFKVVSEPKEQFIFLSVIVIVVGISINLLFIFVIQEIKLSNLASQGYKKLESLLNEEGVKLGEDSEKVQEEIQMKPRDWLRRRSLYLIGTVYMLARMTNNMASSLMPFYLTVVLNMGGVHTLKEASKKTPWEVALIPLIMYFGSVGGSIIQSKIGNSISRRNQFVIGAVAIIAGTIPMIFLNHETRYGMIPLAILLGFGFSFELNSSMGIISGFIGSFGTSGAFVWGTVSLLDKVCTGTVLVLATNLGDFNHAEDIRVLAVIVPLGASMLGGILCFFVKTRSEFTQGIDKKSFVLSE